MKKFLLLFLSVVLLLTYTLTGCTNSEIIDDKSNEIILYNRYSQKLIKYNLDNKKAITIYDQINTFEYEFPDNDILYVTGNSFNNNFKLLQISGDSLKVLLELEPSEAIFPLLTNNDNYYFIHAYYDSDMGEITSKRCIALLDMQSMQLKDLEYTRGLIDKGTVLNKTLYYTEYNNESDDYCLYKIEFASLNFEKPQRIEEHLTAGDIYNDGSNIWLKDGDYLVSKNKNLKIKAAFFNYFIDKYVVQIDVNEKGILILRIVDRNTCKVNYEKDNIYDFKNTDNKIVIYGNGFIEEFTL